MPYINFEAKDQTIKVWPSERIEEARKEIAKRDGVETYHLDFIGSDKYEELDAEIFSFVVNCLGQYYRSIRSWTFYK